MSLKEKFAKFVIRKDGCVDDLARMLLIPKSTIGNIKYKYCWGDV